MRRIALLALLVLGACERSPDPADPAFDAVENAYKSGLMATFCLDVTSGPVDPFLSAELNRRDRLVREARERGMAPAFDSWRAEWKALTLQLDLDCSSTGRMAADLRSWNDRLAFALEELG